VPPLTVRRYSDLLRKLLALKGQDAIQDFGDVLVPVIVLEADRPDWLFLRGETRYAAIVITAIPGGGLFAVTELRNPPGSRVLATLEAVLFLTSLVNVAASYNLGVFGGGASLGGSVAKGIPLDLRESFTKTSAVETRLTAASGAIGVVDANAVDQVQLTSTTEENQPFLLSPGIVIPPNTSIRVAARGAVQQVAVIYQWRERIAEDSELPG
jgi:hypothetical protein